MTLSSLSLQNFRNFEKREFRFSPTTTVIVGPNTSGKTNILEAIYMLAVGSSFRAGLEREVIAWGEEVTRIKGVTQKHSGSGWQGLNHPPGGRKHFPGVEEEEKELEIIITTGSIGGKKVHKKQFLVNGVKKRMVDFLGNFYAVLFSPQDLQLVTNSPSLRRGYLNDVLSSVDKEYRQALLVYKKALRQRNRVLEKIREKKTNPSQLDYWDRLLIENGTVITKKREEFIGFVNQFFNRWFKRLKTSVSEIIKMRPSANYYNFTQGEPIGGFKEETLLAGFGLVYEKNKITQERLKNYQEKEVILGVTLSGPHRDEIKFQISNFKFQISRDLSIYGSRGEQRLAILWLKLAELGFIEEKSGEKPTLLLDDIFSELDKNCRRLVTKTIPNQQTIVTTTDLKMMGEKFLRQAEVIKLEI